MNGFVSRWVVGERLAVEAGDLDADGVVSRAALERWITDTCGSYVARTSTLASCASASGGTLRTRVVSVHDDAVTGRPARVIVSAGATELLPTAVVVAVRLRFTGGHEDQLVNARCEVSVEHSDGSAEPLGADVRDELIALEHAATFTN